MEACRGELSFEPRDLAWTPVAVAEHNGKPIGVAQVKVVDGEADLLKLFVEPSALQRGIGTALLVWVTDVAKNWVPRN
jgi:GNAT superfamily N-acetyltransferase